MSLKDQFASPPTKPPRCPVARLLSTLPEEEAEYLARMLTSDAWSSAAIARALDNDGYTVDGKAVKDAAIQRHQRRGECGCP